MSILLHMTSGMELKLLRVAADVKTRDLADAMGVTNSRVSHIEKLRIVTPEADARYRAALDMCVTNSTKAAA